MVERIVEELDTLWERFKDIDKLKNFLETFISNHIEDFLVKITSKTSKIENSAKQKDYEPSETDSRTEEDPNERLQRELAERRKMNTALSLPEQKEDSQNDVEEHFRNEENMEEKNGSINLDNMMNNKTQQNYPQMKIGRAHV